MPTFYAAGTNIQLSTACLEDVTTARPVQNQCPQTSREIESIARAFIRGSVNGTLTEVALEDEASRSHVRFLGRNKDMPFFMVLGGQTFWDDHLSGTQNRTRRAARPPSPTSLVDKPPVIPHALCLTVYLSPASFIRTDPGRKNDYYDIKIDVFFNAVLANSTIVPSRYRNDQNSMTEHVVRFAGHRVARMLEKPWVFNPPSQFSDYVKAASHASRDAGQRWKAVSSALLKEADDLGRNSQGDRPAIGEYLESLASQPMPCNSAGMSSSLKHNFGIIDIVITYGRGAKLGPDTPYLTEPTPLKLLGFGPSSSPDEDRLGSFTRKKDVGSRHSLIEPPRTRTNDATTRSSRVFRSVSALQPKIPPPTPSGEPRKISHLMTFVGDGNSRVKRQAFEALKDGDLDSLLKQPPEEAWRGIATDSGAAVTPHSPHLEPTLPSRPTPPTNKVNGPSPNSQAAAAALLELSTLQTANSHSGRSTVPANSHTSPCVPQTKPSDFKSQNTESTLRPASFTRTSSAGPPEESSTYPHSPQSSALTSPPPELSDDDSTNPAEASKRSSRSGASIWVKLKYTQPLSSHASTISTDISPFKSPKANKATDGPPSTPLQTARPSRSQTPIQTGTFAARQSPVWCSSHLDKGFVPGPLSEGCRIGFAEPGVVRNVGSVRGGWFKEAGVLMGVRFIVG